MRLVKVTNLTEAFAVALIRNDCREFMTGNTGSLNCADQIRFYATELRYRKPRFELFLAYHLLSPVGYGLLKWNDDHSWVCLTGGLIPSFRGKGLGKRLFKLLIEQSPSAKHWLKVQRTNHRAYALYKKLGFKVTESDNLTFTMTLEP